MYLFRAFLAIMACQESDAKKNVDEFSFEKSLR